MPSAIIATVGGTTSNSYVTLTDAGTYFGDRLNSETWTSATEAKRTISLLMAAKRLDAFPVTGRKVDTDQAMEWPRLDVVKPNSRPYVGSLGSNPGRWAGYSTDYYLETEIPLPIKEAQMELALAYLEGFSEDGGGDAISEFSADGVSVVMDTTKTKTGLPSQVMRLIAPFLYSPRSIRG